MEQRWMRVGLVVVVLIGFSSSWPAGRAGAGGSEGGYVCPPCQGFCHPEDKVYDTRGICPDCGMSLVFEAAVQVDTKLNNPANYPDVTPADVCRILDENPDVVLLDVRSVGEFEGSRGNLGRLRGAINIPVQQLKERVGELETYREREIIVYCSISIRSPRASRLLVDSGFERIRNMLGGMSRWESEEDFPCQQSLLEKP